MKRFALTLSVLFHSLSLVLLSSCGTYVHYQVKPGDSLYSIGFKHEVDYKTLAEWNNIPPPYVIHEGQWLRVVSPLQEEEQQKPEVTEKLNDVQRIKNKIVKRPQASPKIAKERSINNSSSKPAKSVSVPFEDSGIDWVWPTKGKVTKYFSQDSQGKKGIDISGNRGQTVVAAADGIVVYSGSGIIGLGNLVIIKHNKTYLSAYAHNDSLLVNEGQQVKQGQQIAKMGDTGTERVLLHFEIRKDGKPVNPLQYLAENNP